MTTAAHELLKAFDALSPTERKAVANEILRRTVSEGDLPTAALDELADEIFRCYDAEEAERAKTQTR